MNEATDEGVPSDLDRLVEAIGALDSFGEDDARAVAPDISGADLRRLMWEATQATRPAIEWRIVGGRYVRIEDAKARYQRGLAFHRSSVRKAARAVEVIEAAREVADGPIAKTIERAHERLLRDQAARAEPRKPAWAVGEKA